MPIVHAGDINLNAQVVPNLLVRIVPPQVQLVTGVPTNVIGGVGTASWGPVGVAAIVGNHQQYVRTYGPVMARPRDLGTLMATAHQQGAQDFRLVRVTDGTDTAATFVVPTDAITFTARYSGALGNRIRVVVSAGSKPATWRVVVHLSEAGYLPEVFDNLAGTGNALWVAMADAINNGQFGIRSGSEIIVATAGAGTTAASAATYSLAGGTDGVTGVTDTSLIGQETTPRLGMYALRGSGASIVALSECVDATTWAAQVTFGRSEGAYMIGVGPKGDTVSNAVTEKSTAGIDDPAMKLLFGDWIYWMDTTNGQPERLVSPQGFVAGRLATLSPEQSSLNKPIYNVVSTQRTKLARPYSEADLQTLGQAGIDVMTNPVPGGAYFGMRLGRNTSSNPVVRGDNYTRMTNFIASTLDRGMGRFIGRLNSARVRGQAKVTLDAFLGAMMPLNPATEDGMIEDFETKVDESNNPPNRRALGYLQADVQVRFLGIVEWLVVNLEGGQSVQITRAAIRSAEAPG